MDTFVDSSWYFLRYLDNQNTEALASLEQQKDWMPIDMYFGGAEHTTMHLLYSRFWQKALFDLGLATESEPYHRRVNRGLILGPDGNKMSKSKGNVIDPDEQVRLVGADTVKMYLAFMGPYEGNNYPWDMGGIAGIRRFLERVNGLSEHIVADDSPEATRQLHKMLIKVAKDTAEFKFNTAISAMMVFVNTAEKAGLTRTSYELLLRALAPYAAHLTEEIWHELGHTTSIHLEAYPIGDQSLAADTEIVIGVQVNGKLRGDITTTPDASESTVLELARGDQQISRYVSGGTIKKVIYIPGKILNIIVA
jgi:leucyl-tRNA synthetase